MANWKNATLSGIIPSEIATIANQAQTITSTVSTLLGIVKSAIDLARPITGFPNVDFASALITAVEAFKNDFLGFGFYTCAMWDYPLRQYYRSGAGGEEFIESFQTDLLNSMTDPYDPNAPTFSGETAMLVLVGGTSGELSAIIDAIVTVSTAFPTWGDIAKAADKVYEKVWEDTINSMAANLKETSYFDKVADNSKLVKKALKAKYEALENLSVDDLKSIIPSSTPTLAEVESFISDVESRVSASGYPDWESTTLRKIVPPLENLIDQALEPLIQSLQSGAGILAAIDEFLEVLDFKVVQLQQLTEKIDAALEALENISALGDLYSLYVTSSSGVGGLAQELQFSTNQPFGTDKGFYFGAALLGGGPGITPFKNVFSNL